MRSMYSAPIADRINIHFSDQESLLAVIANSLDQATAEIMVMHAYIDSSFFTSAIQNAISRGVAVRILVNRDYASGLHELSSVGAKIKLFLPDERIWHLHHKVIVIDHRRVLVGTVNLFDRSLFLDQESLFVVDAIKVASCFKHEFEKIWQGDQVQEIDFEDSHQLVLNQGNLSQFLKRVGKRRIVIGLFLAGILASSLFNVFYLIRIFGK